MHDLIFALYSFCKFKKMNVNYAKNPAKYKDEYRTALMELIEEKKANSTVTATDKKPLPDNVTDLMSALQASLDKTKKPTRKKTTEKIEKIVSDYFNQLDVRGMESLDAYPANDDK